MPLNYYASGTATYTTSSTGTDTSDQTWTTWAITTSGTTSNITSATVTWNTWVCQPAIETRREQQQRRHQAEKEKIERAAAVKAAEKILLDHLNEQQRDEYRRLSSFRVIKGEKVYRIKRGRTGNVELLDGEAAVESYCIHPIERVPDEDTMLIQKLMLENDEQSFRQVANITELRRAV